MTYHIMGLSVVVRASAPLLAPSMLHPSSLVAQGVLEPSWLLREPPVVTPSSSRLVYNTHVLIAMDLSALVVQELLPPDDLSDAWAPRITAKITDQIGGVRIAAVGFTFRAIVPMENAHSYLVERYSGAAEQGCQFQIRDVVLHGSYDLENDTEVGVEVRAGSLPGRAEGSKIDGDRIEMVAAPNHMVVESP